jgi:hypothetical protein
MVSGGIGYSVGSPDSATGTIISDYYSATALLSKRDTTTEGNWIGAYGSQGYDIAATAPGLPSYAIVGLSGAQTMTWAASTTDPRALQTPDGSSRAATGWFSPSSFTIDVRLTDRQVHELTLYALDWDNQGRQELIQVIDPVTGNVLDAEVVSGFSGGMYLQWAVIGHVHIVVTNLGPANAVISGLFLDPVIPTPPTILDSGFEQPSAGSYGSYIYDPSGTAWTFAGRSGVAANGSGFTSGNPPAPQGSQVGFLQKTGSFTQVVSGWSAGSYVISFDAAQRGNYNASHQNFEVLVDGAVVGTYTPSGKTYQLYTTATFTVSAGSHTIAFQGLDTAGGDNTALVDAVSVATVQAGPPAIGDAGFEQPSAGPVGSYGSFIYDPSGAAWTFAGRSGVAANGSGFTSGNPPAPEGVQVGFLQKTGSFTQVVSGWSAGSYVISFDAAQRGNYNASQQDFEVLVDGAVVGTFTPSGKSYRVYSTATFTVSAGSHTIAFQGLDSAGGDNTALVDAVTIAGA